MKVDSMAATTVDWSVERWVDWKADPRVVQRVGSKGESWAVPMVALKVGDLVGQWADCLADYWVGYLAGSLVERMVALMAEEKVDLTVDQMAEKLVENWAVKLVVYSVVY